MCDFLQFIGFSLNKHRINIWNIRGESAPGMPKFNRGGGGGQGCIFLVEV